MIAVRIPAWKGWEMNKKVMVVGIVVIIAVAGFMAGWYVLSCYMGIGPVFPFLPEKEVSMKNLQEEQTNLIAEEKADLVAEEQLMALVETEEEAESIAEQYGIELTSFSEGVAVYKTEENPADVIARGQDNGYPQLFMNLQRRTMLNTN